jgi:hypothetical protein
VLGAEIVHKIAVNRGLFDEFLKRSTKERISDGGHFDAPGYIRFPKINAGLENLLDFSGFSE